MLTTGVWDTFADFCRKEGLEPDTIKNLFRTDPEAIRELRQLEMGEITETEFEQPG